MLASESLECVCWCTAGIFSRVQRVGCYWHNTASCEVLTSPSVDCINIVYAALHKLACKWQMATLQDIQHAYDASYDCNHYKLMLSLTHLCCKLYAVRCVHNNVC